MALLDFLNTSLVINIGTLILLVVLVGGLYAYFSSKLSAQDHKISSMVSCVSTMAEEIQSFRKQMIEQCGHPQMMNSVHLPSHTLTGGNDINRHLIEVSDDEDEDDTDDETHDDDNSSDNDSCDDDASNESYSDDDDDNDDNDDDDNQDIQAHNILDHPLEMHETLDIEDTDHLSQLDDLSVNDNNIRTIHIDEDNQDLMLDDENIDLTKLPIPHIKEEPHTEDNLVNSNHLKTISLVDIDHDVDDADGAQDLDYKKMNLTKLREIVVKKKLTNDASKMKKNDILKILGVE